MAWVHPRWRRFGPGGQVLATAVMLAALILWADRAGLRTYLHILWMVGVPLLVAAVANKDAPGRALMALILMLTMPVVLIATAAAFDLGS